MLDRLKSEYAEMSNVRKGIYGGLFAVVTVLAVLSWTGVVNLFPV